MFLVLRFLCLKNFLSTIFCVFLKMVLQFKVYYVIIQKVNNKGERFMLSNFASITRKNSIHAFDFKF